MDIVMPQLGETVTEGTVTVWRKKPGETVKANEVLFEVSTDKVETEIPAPADGVLTEIMVGEGETVDVGVTLGVLEGEGATSTAITGVDVVMPQLGETVTEGTVTVWRKKPGDAVSPDDVLFEVSTDKVETEIPAPVAGVLTEILVGQGETVDVGTRLGVISGAATAAAPARPTKSTPAPTSTGSGVGALMRSVRNRDARGLPLSPVVRRLIAENGLDADAIAGTGRDGRITRRDVMKALGGPPRPTLSGDEATEIVPLSRLRKQIGDHMVRSKTTSAHVLQAVEVEFHRVEEARAAHRESWRAREGFGLTYLPFIARAVCDAIPDFPNVNASIEGDNMIVHRRVNLGVAVDLSFEGLIVPVVKDAGRKSLREIAREISALAEKARIGGLAPDDLTEGTYTLSNSGPYGTLITAPVISQPQIAILSTDGVRKKPVVIEGPQGDAIAIRPVGVLAQSFDHRAIDGAYSAAFLARVREIIETRDWSAELA